MENEEGVAWCDKTGWKQRADYLEENRDAESLQGWGTEVIAEDEPGSASKYDHLVVGGKHSTNDHLVVGGKHSTDDHLEVGGKHSTDDHLEVGGKHSTEEECPARVRKSRGWQRGRPYGLRPRGPHRRERRDSEPPLSGERGRVGVRGVGRRTKYRRNTANARERDRMKEINIAFANLRGALPAFTCRRITSMTKIRTLRLAASYIQTLDNYLREPPSESSDELIAHIIAEIPMKKTPGRSNFSSSQQTETFEDVCSRSNDSGNSKNLVRNKFSPITQLEANLQSPTAAPTTSPPNVQTAVAGQLVTVSAPALPPSSHTTENISIKSENMENMFSSSDIQMENPKSSSQNSQNYLKTNCNCKIKPTLDCNQSPLRQSPLQQPSRVNHPYIQPINANHSYILPSSASQSYTQPSSNHACLPPAHRKTAENCVIETTRNPTSFCEMIAAYEPSSRNVDEIEIHACRFEEELLCRPSPQDGQLSTRQQSVKGQTSTRTSLTKKLERNQNITGSSEAQTNLLRDALSSKQIRSASEKATSSLCFHSSLYLFSERFETMPPSSSSHADLVCEDALVIYGAPSMEETGIPDVQYPVKLAEDELINDDVLNNNVSLEMHAVLSKADDNLGDEFFQFDRYQLCNEIKQ